MLNESFSVIFKYREYWKGQRAVYCWNWLQPWMKLLNQSYFSDFYRTTKTCWDSLIKIQLSHNSHNCIFMRVGEFLPTQDQVEFDMPSLKNEWMSCFIYTNGLNAVCNHPWLHQHKKCVSSSKRCLKVTEKVSFKIASEASYVYILSGQKFIRNEKNGQFGEFFKTWNLRSNSVTRQVSFIKTKWVKNAKIQMWHFEWFSNTVELCGTTM